MSKYMLIQLEKNEGESRQVHYSIFSTNYSPFRKFFPSNVRGSLTLTYDSFLSLFTQTFSMRTLHSIFRERGNWIQKDDPHIEIGIAKIMDFSCFLLEEKDFFELKRKDGKTHLEKQIKPDYHDHIFPFQEVSDFILFRPPDSFSNPSLITLKIIDKSYGRKYCYISFQD